MYNKKKQHLAAAFQLLLPGMPMVYYGDEYAMPGANAVSYTHLDVYKRQTYNSCTSNN